MKKITKDILRKVYPKRELCSHKYDNGYLLVVGGGEHYTGSPALAGLAGFRAGVDMVRVLAPEKAADIIAGFSPNLATYGFKGAHFDAEDLPLLLNMAEAARAVSKERTALVIGGGLGRSEETQKVVLDFLSQTSIKTVVDADAIYALKMNPSVRKGLILTPHSNEFFVLTKRDLKGLSLEKKAEAVKEEAGKLSSVILLTGEKDIISNGQEVYINETGTPFMTVGGTGDTLAGICGGLLAQGVEPFLAAQGAAFINGKAGELSSEKFGIGMLATDLIKEIPNVVCAT